MKGRLIINADDFGLCESVNQAIIEVYQAGNLTSTTLMVNMPGTEDAVRLAKENPGLAIGLHFCISEGKPLTAAKSLVDESGVFLRRPELIKKAFNKQLDANDIKNELIAQLDKFESFGIPLSHSDSHQHLHMLPFVFNAMKDVLSERGVPVRIVQPQKAIDFSLLFSRPIKAAKQFVNYQVGNKIKNGHKGLKNQLLTSIHELEGDINSYDSSVYQDLLSPLDKSKSIELMVHPFKRAQDVEGLYADEIDTKMTFLEKCYKEHEWMTEKPLFDNFELITFRQL